MLVIPQRSRDVTVVDFGTSFKGDVKCGFYCICPSRKLEAESYLMQLLYNTALPLADSAVDQCIRKNKHQVSSIQTKQLTNYLLWSAIFFVD